MPLKALLIVDVQNDFFPGGALRVPDGKPIIPLINRLQESFSCIVATKDWHPPHHISFASTHGKKPGEIVEVGGMKQVLWPDHCVQGTPGAEFSPLLHKEKIDQVFFKGVDPMIDSYSTFYDNAHLRETGLEKYLRERGINEIVLVGLTTEYCVKYSVLDALELGFKITVVLDGCRGVELHPGDCARAIEVMRAAGATIVTTLQI